MPVGIDFSDPAVRANPYAIYTQLRAQNPVVWNGQSWLISRYEEIIGLLSDERVSSARAESIFQVLPEDVRQELQPLRHILGSRMLLTDAPTHTRLRNLVTKAFSARMVREKRTRIHEICDQFIDRVIESGEMDVIRDLAVPVPSWVIADMLGVSREDQANFTRWSSCAPDRSRSTRPSKRCCASRVRSKPPAVWRATMIKVSGYVIEPGQGISLLFGSANRDEAQFTEPETFDLGAAIARAEAQIAVQTAIQRCEHLELLTDDADWLEGFSFRGMKTLPIRFTAA